MASNGGRDRGSVLAMSAISIVAVVGVSALAIDLGMLYVARSEAQQAAEAGALAGASRYVSTNGDDAAATATAREFAEKHTILDEPVSVPAEDVEVVAGEDKVRVTVTRDVQTHFARILGIQSVRVEASAGAEAAPASAARCPLPIAVVDRWNDADGDGKYDSDETYVPCPGPGCTSWTESRDRGQLMEIKSSPGGGGPGGGPPGGGNGNGGGSSGVVNTCEAVDSPGWFCWFREAPSNQGGGGGTTALRNMVDGCTDQPLTVALGNTVWAASGAGNKQTVVKHVKQYIDRNDPNAFWNPVGGDDGSGCVKRPTELDCVEGSPRLRHVPLLDPTSVQGGGSNSNAQTSQLARVFLEKVAAGPYLPHGGGGSGQWNVYVRFVGGGGGIAGGEFQNSLARAIRLVE